MPRRMHPEARKRFLRHALRRDGFLCVLCLVPLRFPFETGIEQADGSTVPVTVDHVNNTPSRHKWEELACLCAACNIGERNKRQSGGTRSLNLDNLAEHQRAARRRAAEQAPGCPFAEGWVLTSETGSAPNAGADETGVHSVQVTAVCERETERETAPPPAPKPMIARARPEADALDRAVEDAAVLQELMNPLYRLWLFVYLVRHGDISTRDALDAGSEYLDLRLGRGNQQTVSRYLRKAASLAGWLSERDGRGWELRAGINKAEQYHLFHGRVLALCQLLSGPKLDLSDLTLSPEDLR